jgi:hypothetical protein
VNLVNLEYVRNEITAQSPRNHYNTCETERNRRINTVQSLRNC